MVKAGLATAAAPTYFRPLEHQGYTLVDGGVWANNPIMLAVIEALICFDVDRSQIDVLSLGCGDDPYVVSPLQSALGGKLTWYNLIFAAMRLQSLAATNQARLLLGPPAIRRIDPPPNAVPIKLDDFRRSRDELVPAAAKAVDEHGDRIAACFLSGPAVPFVPVPPEVLLELLPETKDLRGIGHEYLKVDVDLLAGRGRGARRVPRPVARDPQD